MSGAYAMPEEEHPEPGPAPESRTCEIGSLVWSDEFDQNGLPDASKWRYDTGGHGWGNQELQYYTSSRSQNARVENGNLIIEARKESWSGSEYTSARLLSRQEWTYGRFEARAKLPSGRGTWPAIWMLPDLSQYGGWPRAGEIDIMEHVGFDPDRVHSTVHTDAYNHTKGTHRGASTVVSTARSAFNVYAVEWTPSEIRGYVNDTHYFTFRNERLTNSQADDRHWPFDHPFHLIFNIAVGGSWGGQQGVDPNIWPQRLEVDYVRVYACGNSTGSTNPTPPSDIATYFYSPNNLRARHSVVDGKAVMHVTWTRPAAEYIENVEYFEYRVREGYDGDAGDFHRGPEVIPWTRVDKSEDGVTIEGLLPWTRYLLYVRSYYRNNNFKTPSSANRMNLPVIPALPSSTSVKDGEVPVEVTLGQNYPNPFNPVTSISYSLPKAGHIDLAVYDMTGKMVAQLVDGMTPAGHHAVSFDAGHLPSGVYTYVLSDADHAFPLQRKQMILLK